MNVRLLSDALQTAPAKKVDAVQSGRTSSREAAPDAPAASDAGSSDRVEISAEARARAADASPSTSLELEVARVALRAGSSLSDSRLHELRQRVRTGYYDTPATVDRIGEAVARDLAQGA